MTQRRREESLKLAWVKGSGRSLTRKHDSNNVRQWVLRLDDA